MMARKQKDVGNMWGSPLSDPEFTKSADKRVMTTALSLWRGVITIKPRMADICDMIASRHGVYGRDLRARGSHPYLNAPRQEFMAYARQAGYSTTQIGNFLGGRDHSTVISGAKRHLEREGAVA